MKRLYSVMRIMENSKFSLLACGLLLTGCLYQSPESQSPETDPYDGLSCEEKIAKMTRELQAYETAPKPLAKTSFVDPVRIGTEDADSIPGDANGIPVDSTRTPIQVFRGFPPVAGYVGTDTTHLSGTQVDSRPNPINGNADYGAVWIPPFEFSDSGKTLPPNSLPTAPAGETTAPMPIPSDITAVQVISSGKYKAHVRILDYKKDLVREFDQEFGYQGELQNPSRVVAGGLVSYLVWDNKTSEGKRAGDGVYLWEARMTPESGQVQDMSAKTGLLGEDCESKP